MPKMIAAAMPPTVPAIVLFGETFGAMRLRPIASQRRSRRRHMQPSRWRHRGSDRRRRRSPAADRRSRRAHRHTRTRAPSLQPEQRACRRDLPEKPQQREHDDQRKERGIRLRPVVLTASGNVRLAVNASKVAGRNPFSCSVLQPSVATATITDANTVVHVVFWNDTRAMITIAAAVMIAVGRSLPAAGLAGGISGSGRGGRARRDAAAARRWWWRRGCQRFRERILAHWLFGERAELLLFVREVVGEVGFRPVAVFGTKSCGRAADRRPRLEVVVDRFVLAGVVGEDRGTAPVAGSVQCGNGGTPPAGGSSSGASPVGPRPRGPVIGILTFVASSRSCASSRSAPVRSTDLSPLWPRPQLAPLRRRGCARLRSVSSDSDRSRSGRSLAGLLRTHGG